MGTLFEMVVNIMIVMDFTRNAGVKEDARLISRGLSVPQSCALRQNILP